MPTADSGIVRRVIIPAAMPSWMAPTSAELVLSSGVRRMPPAPQIAMKKKAQAARKTYSILSRSSRVTRSNARNIAVPTGVPSNTAPVIKARTESPIRNSKSGQSTFSRPSGWPATS